MAEEVLEPPGSNISTGNLPDDVLMEILLKLPVSSLLLIKSVCKRWLGLIKSPNFINLHLNRPIDDCINNPMLVAHAVETGDLALSSKIEKELALTSITYDGTLTFKDYSCMSADEPPTYTIDLSSMSDDENLDDYGYSTYDIEYLPCKDKLPLEFMSSSMADCFNGLERLQLLGPCNGLFCITDAVDNVVVFNPATRKCRKVNRAPTTSRIRSGHDFGDFDSVGFCYDPVCNDYMVVRFDQQECGDHVHRRGYHRYYQNQQISQRAYSEDDDDVTGDNDDVDFSDNLQFRIGVYSLSTDSWRELDRAVPGGSIISRKCKESLFFNGGFHWLGGDCIVDDDDNYDYINSVLVFGLKDEAFKWFKLPGSYPVILEGRVRLSILNESLALMVQMIYGCEIWVMTEHGVCESWRKLYDISADVGIARPFSLSTKGEFLVEFKYGELASFNLETKAIRLFNIRCSWFDSLNHKTSNVKQVPGLLNAVRYRESLVSLK